ncbi:ribosome biogenesis GTPase Der [Olsenella sp. An188]|uniref:ribosome biogenesis GTPase Der n=1 Tax=Olsenella sp. An188 TaxID=1965579 RepID=UPI000B39CE3D|nr:ribosome biogenesis GTPase Der [Olsenella sp. An188]OUP39523.1 ribosome biogenesis GTPase Der [Olsenella sp. An188]HBO62509.1 ribosome biogenesis GTPase Der [Olsenella sp.]HJB54196.1 ribosome biogenesis GTPase Der [Candidatus Olsenella avistercoris]
MPKPVVAVVGRPNVGKSTLVNRIAVSRDAIVHESRGVTRDRSYHEADWNGRDFTLVDTGGIESAKSKDVFAPRIREQALMACEEADVIVFVVDGTTGVTDEDEEVARILRKTDKPVFLVVNKKDNPATEQDGLWDFYALGVGEPRPLSAGHGHGTGDLLDDIVAAFPEPTDEEADDDVLSLAIVGRPNVGKSSLANRLANKKRSIVSDVAGTTRDAIDTMIEWKGMPIKLVDTAGMRKKTQVHEDVEYYSLVRGLQAIDRADVCLLVVDATVGVTEQDQKVAGMAIDRGCALVLVLNKWDLVETEQQRDAIVASIDKRLAFAPWIPSVNVSALTGRATDKVLGLAVAASEARASQLKTSELNDLIAQIREGGHTRSERGRRLKIRYATQTGSKPPVISFWCNAPDLVDDNFERFIENRLRDRFDLTGTPVRLKFRKSNEGGDR